MRFPIHTRADESRLKSTHKLFDAVEIHGMASFAGINTILDDDTEPELWGVFLHLKTGGIEDVGEFSTQGSALIYAHQLRCEYHFGDVLGDTTVCEGLFEQIFAEHLAYIDELKAWTKDSSILLSEKIQRKSILKKFEADARSLRLGQFDLLKANVPDRRMLSIIQSA